MSRALSRFAWSVLAYNLAVILWGAYVRASGSGAGCGAHWPLCNGEVIPRSPSVATLIEYSHRLTSGLALIGVVWLLAWTRRAVPPQHPARRGAWLSLFFILTEAAVGAGLVLFELVADNATMARAMFMAAHLVNTFLLVADRAAARFVVESELFLFPDSTDEGVGVFVGGQTLGDSESPAYTALMMRKDGSASVVRRAAGESTDLSPWAAVSGVKPHGGKDAEKHALRIEADATAVTFLVDGAKVASHPRADVAPEGHFGFRIGRGVNIHVVRLDFTQQLAPPRVPKPAP